MAKNVVEILIRARDEASKEIKKTGDAVVALQKQTVMASAAISAIGAGAVTGLAAAALAGGRYADALDDLSARTLVSREMLAALGVQLVKGGGQFGDAEQAIRKFASAVIDAVSGQQEAVAQFARLGISVNDLVGPGGSIRSFEELLPVVANGFQKLNNRALQVDTTVNLFGRSATKMIPLLSGGSQGIAEMASEAERANAVLSGPIQAAAARLGDRVDDLKISTTGLANALAGSLDPTLGATITALAEAAKATGQFAQAHPVLIQNITATVAAIAGAAGLIAALGLARSAIGKFFGFIQAVGIIKALGGSFTDAAGKARLAGGQFASARQATLANAVAFIKFNVVVLAASTAVGLLVAAHQRHRAAVAADRAATDALSRSMNSQALSAEQQIQAYNALREKTGKVAAETAAKTATFSNMGVVKVDPRIAQDEALAKFDKEHAKLRESITARFTREPITVGGVIVFEPEVKLGPTAERARLAVPSPEIDIEKLDSRAINDSIDLQEAEVEKARERMSELARRINDLSQKGQSAQPTIELIRPQFDEAKKEFDSASDRLDSLRDRASRLSDEAERTAEKQRDLAETSRELAQALTELDRKASGMALDDVLKAQRDELVKASEALKVARDRYQGAAVGTREYEQAQSGLEGALNTYLSTASRVESTEATIRTGREQDADAARSLDAAYRALAEAQQRLQVTQAAPNPDAAEAALKALEIQQAAQRLEAARAQVVGMSMLGITDPIAKAAAINEVTDAMDALAESHRAATQTQNELNLGAEVGQSAFSAFGSAITGAFAQAAGAVSGMGAIIVGVIQSIISALIQAAIKAIFFKSALGIVTGGANLFSDKGFTGLAGAFTGAATGGEITTGVRGRDTVPIMGQRNENILDSGTNNRLKRMLGAFESGNLGGGGGVTVHVNAGLMAGSEADAQTIARTIIDRTQDYLSTGIAVPGIAVGY